MKQFIRIAPLLFVAMLIASHTQANEGAQWKSTGPYGGLIWSIQVDTSNSKRLVAWTTGGCFLSENAGESWKRIIVPKGFEYNKRVKLIGSKLYCFRSDDIFCSENNTTWEIEANMGFEIYDITCEPGKPEKLRSMIIKSEKGAYEYYMHSKKDKGWHSSLMGTTPLLHPSWYYTLSSPADTSIIRVFVLFDEPEEKTIVFGSDDGGMNWKQWTIDIKPRNAIFSQKDKRIIYGACYKEPGKMSGLVKSADTGKTWTPLSDDERLLNMRSLMLHPKSGNLYLGTNDKGLFMTKDEGKTLVELNNGFYSKSVSALACDPENGNILYVGTQCGLYKSEDGGKRWKWMSEGIEGCQIMGVLNFQEENNKIVVFDYPSGIKISNNGGKTWEPPFVPETLAGSVFNILQLKNIIIATTRYGDDDTPSISKDFGRTWKKIEGLGAKDYVISVISENEIYAVRDLNLVVKGGMNKPWKVLSKPFDNDTVRWIGKPAEKDYLVVIGDRRIAIISPETGKRIFTIEPPEGHAGFATLYHPSFDPWKPEHLYILNHSGGVFRYDIPNKEWSKLYSHKVDTGRDNWFGIVVFDPGRRGRLIAGYTDGFLAISEDYGKSWKEFKPELPFYKIKNMDVSKDRILVVTGNGTIYRLDLSKLDKDK